MLAFLDVLCRVLATRNREDIRRQLRHPLARSLPPAVRAEALAIARSGPDGHLAPTRTLRFYYQSIQLLSSTDERDLPSVSFDGHRTRRAPATVFAGVR